MIKDLLIRTLTLKLIETEQGLCSYTAKRRFDRNSTDSYLKFYSLPKPYGHLFSRL